MGDPRGFLKVPRRKGSALPVAERLRGFEEFERPLDAPELRAQASRCMDCGVPFCHRACPLGNHIPDWNDAYYRGDPTRAAAALEATNNFPEITGRICPAPCEASCVLNLQGAPVTIKDVERAIGDSLTHEPRPAARRLDGRVAVVGSGPAGMAAAQQLARRGYGVSLFERDAQVGGLLRYGIPDFKLDKRVIERRVEQLRGEGVEIVTGCEVGVTLPVERLLRDFDAVVLCLGARKPRPLAVPGAELEGVHYAMDYLTQQNRRVAGERLAGQAELLAAGKRVVILGGGDTGADCLGTALRQGAASVLQLELMPAPPAQRSPTNPWPEWPLVLRSSSAHEEGGEREFAVLTKEVLGHEGRVRALRVVRVELEGGRLRELEGSERELPCDLLLLAMGFVGAETELLARLELATDARGNLPAVEGVTSRAGIFAAGDLVRGASLVVWAIAQGRSAAEQVHCYLSAREGARKSG